MADSEAMWEPTEAFKALFPDFQLADELFLEEGDMLWWGTSTVAVTRPVAEEVGGVGTLVRGHQAEGAPTAAPRIRSVC